MTTLLLDVPAEVTALPPFDLGRVVTEWGVAPVPTVLTAWVVGLYLWGALALRRRGDRWSPARTTSFVAGMLVFYVATSSGLAAYDSVLLSVHMVQHMLLSMAVPLLLALGAPVTLALRTLPSRPRGWLLAVLHSRYVKVLSFPPLAFALFVLSPWALYFSPWYDATLHSALLHELMHVHLVAVGALFLWPLVGVDPVPGRVGYPFRMLLMVMTLPFHAFLGLTIMDQDTLLGGSWYPSLPMAWLPDPRADQELAGGILWSTGDVVGLVFFIVLFVQWARSSMREAEREDRRLDLEERRSAAGAASGAASGPAAGSAAGSSTSTIEP